MKEIREKTGNQSEAPLFNAARRFLFKNYLPLHVPLHGRGAGAPHLLRRGLGGSLRWDFTEVDLLDDLHLPRGALRRAQELAAETFQAEKTFFLVNGVTGGILALLLAFTRPGDKVILTRLAHKSVLHGIILSGALPVYLPVEYEKQTGLPLNVSQLTVKRALQEHPEAKMVFITSPSYWGVTADLFSLRKITRGSKVLLAVDEAHGGHLSFYPVTIPHSAAAGADLWLHSAHKSLGSLTPGAFLHLGKKKLAAPLQFWLQAIQTSSPPYPVMISLDLARRQAAIMGRILFGKSWEWASKIRRELSREGLELFSLAPANSRGFDLDPCRLTLVCRRGGGCHLASRLAREYGLQIEMAEESYLLAVLGPALLSLSPRRLAKVISAAATSGFPKNKGAKASPPCFWDFPPSFFRQERLQEFPLTPKEALVSPSLSVPLEKSAGMVSGEMVTLSPPGIPLLAPGEIITPEMVEFLNEKKKEGRLFQGAADPALNKIRVVVGKPA